MTPKSSKKDKRWDEGKDYFEFKTAEDMVKWEVWTKTDLIPQIESQAIKKERKYWLNQTANEHDKKIREDERKRTLQKVIKLAEGMK